MMSSFTAWQKTVAVLPKPFSLLSLIGSTYILYYILKDPKRRHTVQHQILLGLSVCDIFYSIAVLLGTLPIPAYVNDEEPTVYLARGNDQTCAAQGFFVQANITSPLYNASLSVYYVAVVKFGWKEDRLKRVRLWFHVVPISIGLGTAIASAALGIFGNSNWLCWIAPEWMVYRWALFFGILWFIGFFVVIPGMLVIYLHVRKQEAIAARWQPGAPERQQFTLSREVALQGLFFSLSYIITWIFVTIARIVESIQGTIPRPLLALTIVFVPMQGLFNALVFLRPRYAKYRRERRGQRGTGEANTAFLSPGGLRALRHELWSSLARRGTGEANTVSVTGETNAVSV